MISKEIEHLEHRNESTNFNFRSQIFVHTRLAPKSFNTFNIIALSMRCLSKCFKNQQNWKKGVIHAVTWIFHHIELKPRANLSLLQPRSASSFPAFWLSETQFFPQKVSKFITLTKTMGNCISRIRNALNLRHVINNLTTFRAF